MKGLNGLKTAITAYHDGIQLKAIKAMESGDRTAASRAAIIEAYDPYMKIDAGFQQMTKLATQATAQQAGAINGSLSSLRTTLLVVAIVGALLFAVIAWLVIGSISRPLRRVVDVLRAIAAGDRTQRVDHAHQDEIGSIADSIDEVVTSLDAADRVQAAVVAEREAAAAEQQRVAVERAELEARAAEERAAAEAQRLAREAQIESERLAAEQAAVGMQEALQLALSYYRAELKKSEKAISYLKGRGLSGEIAARFQMGYAPAGWQNLAGVIKDYQSESLSAAGLVITNDQGRRYDRFRDRVMFPIQNARGAVIGFGGRILDKGETGAGGEIQLTDAMAQLIGKQPFHATRVDAVRHDCGDKAGYVIANLALALERDDISPKIRDYLARL